MCQNDRDLYQVPYDHSNMQPIHDPSQHSSYDCHSYHNHCSSLNLELSARALVWKSPSVTSSAQALVDVHSWVPVLSSVDSDDLVLLVELVELASHLSDSTLDVPVKIATAQLLPAYSTQLSVSCKHHQELVRFEDEDEIVVVADNDHWIDPAWTWKLPMSSSSCSSVAVDGEFVVLVSQRWFFD